MLKQKTYRASSSGVRLDSGNSPVVRSRALNNSSSRPYQITSLHPADDALVPSRAQSVSYTCYDRPSVLVEGGRSVAFTYNGDGDRVKMYVADGTAEVLTRHYIGSRYEHDHTPSGSKERLYLGGDAYSAPMVYQRENGGSWTLYNIGRDYLGNVTHIATSGGTLVAEYSYDPWGRLRDPDTHAVYSPGHEPDLFLGRGFTGHEHLPWFGLVNMNARLYDPLLGRFLSPDPYVQAPDFTQSYNRYSYCLNNPLKYTDPNGEIVITTAIIVSMAVSAVAGAYMGGVLANDGNFNPTKWDWNAGKTWGYIGGGFFIGGISGFVGGVAGTAAAGVSSSGGFIGGAVAGAAGGAAGGAISGFGMTLMATGDMELALNGMIIGTVSGAIGGAIIGGTINGVASVIKGGNFWNGTTPGTPSTSISNENTSINPYDKGRQGVEMADKIITDQGGKVVGHEVSIDVNGTRVRVDGVADFDGRTLLFEVKNGPSAHFTHNQSIAYPRMSPSMPTISPGMDIVNVLSTTPNIQVPITPYGHNAMMTLPQYPIGQPIQPGFSITFLTIRF